MRHTSDDASCFGGRKESDRDRHPDQRPSISSFRVASNVCAFGLARREGVSIAVQNSFVLGQELPTHQRMELELEGRDPVVDPFWGRTGRPRTRGLREQLDWGLETVADLVGNGMQS